MSLPRGARAPARDALGAAAVALIILLFYGWTATDGLFHLNTPGGKSTLLNLQTEAFAAGQLHLQVEPHPSLLAAANPYDPRINRGVRLLDASYFQGRYYTYFGPTPLLLWMLPWYVMTGAHAPPDLSVLVFAALALGWQTATLVLIRRQWFPGVSVFLLCVSVVIAGAGNLIPLLLREHSTFEIPVMSGLAFLHGSFFCALRAQRSPSQAGRWWTWAGLSWALAGASRANLLPFGLPLALLWLWSNRVTLSTGFSKVWPSFVRQASPASAVLLGFGAFNAARFTGPLDFGNRYTLIELDWQHHVAFSPARLATNFYYYFISGPRLSWFFPFFIESADRPAAAPSDYLSYVDRVVGFSWGYPLFLSALALPLFWNYRPTLRPWTLFVFGGTLAIGLPLLFFIGSSCRYQAELAAPFVLLSLTVLFATFELPRRPMRVAAGLAMGVLAAVTVTTNLLVSIATNGTFAAAHPAQYRALAQVSDTAVFKLFSPRASQPREQVFTVRFPADRAGQVEPFWVNGRAPAANFLYLLYHPGGRVQFAFNGTGPLTPVSAPLTLDVSVPHQITLAAGPFAPPLGHPGYRRLEAGDGATFSQLLRLKVDDTIVFESFVQFHDGRGVDHWGVSPTERAFGERFTGTLLHHEERVMEPKDYAALISPASYGEISLRIDWPAEPALRKEPLLRVGSENQGQLFFVEFLETRRARIGLADQGGSNISYSTAFDLSSDSQTLRLTSPAFYLDSTAQLGPHNDNPGAVIVALEDQELLRTASPIRPVGPAEIIPGDNLSEIAGITKTFSGRITISRE